MNDNGHTADKTGQQELAITGVLHRRLEADDCLRPEDRETVAYRVAEIMVHAKSLYTEVLPRLLDQDEADGYTMEEELAGLRMALLHMKDLITDYEVVFMDAMAHQREDDGGEATLGDGGGDEI